MQYTIVTDQTPAQYHALIMLMHMTGKAENSVRLTFTDVILPS